MEPLIWALAQLSSDELQARLIAALDALSLQAEVPLARQ
jgi:hypothetical protein